MKIVPAGVMDIFLEPGDFYFSDKHTRIRTTLGSCIAITIWHPRLLIGGMCHYILSKRPGQNINNNDGLNGKYGDDVMQLFMLEMERTNTKALQYEAKIFGGGDMFNFNGKRAINMNIPNQNAAAAQQLMNQHGFKVHAECMGGKGYRNVVFDVWNGDVWVKRVMNIL